MGWTSRQAVALFHTSRGVSDLSMPFCRPTSVHFTSPYEVLLEVRRPTHADNRDRTDDFPEAVSYHSQSDQLKSEPFGRRRACALKSTSPLMPQCWHCPF